MSSAFLRYWLLRFSRVVREKNAFGFRDNDLLMILLRFSDAFGDRTNTSNSKSQRCYGIKSKRVVGFTDVRAGYALWNTGLSGSFKVFVLHIVLMIDLANCFRAWCFHNETCFPRLKEKKKLPLRVGIHYIHIIMLCGVPRYIHTAHRVVFGQISPKTLGLNFIWS